MNETLMIALTREDLRAMIREETRGAARELIAEMEDVEGWWPRLKVAEMFGLESTETLRDWELRGLLPTERTPDGRAVYPKKAVRDLVARVARGEVKLRKQPRFKKAD